MYLTVHPDNPSPRLMEQAADVLSRGGVIIYPTDTLYALGCDLFNHKALDRMARLRGIPVERALFSLMCPDLSCLADYTRSISQTVFKTIRRNTPGPFTFVLPANSQTPKIWQSRRKTIGIRIPDNAIARGLASLLGHPMVTASVYHDFEDMDPESVTNPELIAEQFENQVDMIINGGMGQLFPSTVVDCTQGLPEVVRQGKGQLL